jgi:hypothetical protein
MPNAQQDRHAQVAARVSEPHPKAADIVFDVGMEMLIALSLALTAQFFLWAISLHD